MELSKKITNRIKHRDNIDFSWEENCLTITSKLSPFDFAISFSGKGPGDNTLWFDDWHWHYRNNEEEDLELFNIVTSIVENKCRIKKVYRGEKLSYTDLEFQDSNGNWQNEGIVGFINWKFWKKKKEVSIKYEQLTFS